MAEHHIHIAFGLGYRDGKELDENKRKVLEANSEEWITVSVDFAKNHKVEDPAKLENKLRRSYLKGKNHAIEELTAEVADEKKEET